jgi:hypothetical protein
VDPEQLKQMLAAIAAMADSVTKLGEKCDAVSAKCDALAEKKKADDDNDTMAQETAADRRADSIQADLARLNNRMNSIDIHSKQNQATRDQFADLQSRADVAYRAWSENCPPPMQGEGVLDFAIRVHRPLMKHSKKFAKTDLHSLLRDPATLNTICDSIRADAVEASMNPTDMPRFVHREIKTESPGGHRITEFVGQGTVFGMLNRPGRRVTHIGFDPRRSGIGQSAGGTVYAADISR